MEAERSQYMISGRRCVWHVPSEQRCLCCWETWRWGRLGMERERKAGSNNPLEKWSPVGDPELRDWRARFLINFRFHRSGKPPREVARPSRSPSGSVPADTGVSHLPAESGSPRVEEARSNSRRVWAVIVGVGRAGSEKPVGEAAPLGCRPTPFPGLENAP